MDNDNERGKELKNSIPTLKSKNNSNPQMFSSPMDKNTTIQNKNQNEEKTKFKRKVRTVLASKDHKPSNLLEKNRILNADGMV